MTTITTNWTPEGAFRTAARRMTKRGATPEIVHATLLTLSPISQHQKAHGNIKGAIKRCVRHGVTPEMISYAMVKVATAISDKAQPSVKKAPAPVKKARRERTPEQIKADKERMAYVRSCRKGSNTTHEYPTTAGYDVEELYADAVKTTHPEDLAAKHGNVAPTERPANRALSQMAGKPIVINSFKELDELLSQL